MSPLDPKGTRRRIFAAAVEEFATHGSAGARVDRIAANARANKESIYRYYGTKDELLGRVLDQYLDERGDELLPKSKDLGSYATDMITHHAAHPEFLRLSLWEALEHGADATPERVQHRRRHYQDKLDSIAELQRSGAVDPDLDPRNLLLVLCAMTTYWFVLPQVVRMVLGEEPDQAALASYHRFVAECLHRITAPPPAEADTPRPRPGAPDS